MRALASGRRLPVLGLVAVAAVFVVLAVRHFDWGRPWSGGVPNAASQLRAAGLAEVQGEVKRVDRETRMLYVSTGFFGLTSLSLLVESDAPIVMDGNPTTLPDIRSGQMLRASYYQDPETREAWAFEVRLGVEALRRAAVLDLDDHDDDGIASAPEVPGGQPSPDRRPTAVAARPPKPRLVSIDVSRPRDRAGATVDSASRRRSDPRSPRSSAPDTNDSHDFGAVIDWLLRNDARR
jgi:hypothetical protein